MATNLIDKEPIMKALRCWLVVAAVLLTTNTIQAQDSWCVYEGNDGPGKGKHIVLVSGDEEYRSEETLPQLGKILAKHHGFKCTVLFAIDPKDGTINPNRQQHPRTGEAQDGRSDDLCLRFRNLPDEQMKYIADYVDSGKPIIGLRTATHSFNIKRARNTPSTASIATSGPAASAGTSSARPGSTITAATASKARAASSPRARRTTRSSRGIKDGDIWGPTDVYTVHLPLPGDCEPLVMGQVLVGMKPSTTSRSKGKRTTR